MYRFEIKKISGGYEVWSYVTRNDGRVIKNWCGSFETMEDAEDKIELLKEKMGVS